MSDFITKADLTGGTATAKSPVLLAAAGVTGAGQTFTVATTGAPRGFLVSGTFVGTVAIQVSTDNTNWYTLYTATAPGAFESTSPWFYVRANVTAWTSGAITVQMVTAI